MENFDVISNIKKDLNQQDNSSGRYPVRFFSVKYAEDTVNYIMKLRSEIENASKNKVEIVDIKDSLPHEDGWITVDKFQNCINKLEDDKNYIVIGFSEYIRFLSKAEFDTMIIGLLETENPSNNYKRRIYIPCFALFSQIRKSIKKNHRRIDLYNPLLNDVNVEDLPVIYFIDEKLESMEYDNKVNNSSGWFGMWRNSKIDVKRPIICTSKRLLYFYEKACPDNVYNIKKIRTYKELLKCLYGIDNIIETKFSSDEYYVKLLKLLRKRPDDNFQKIILQSVNAQKIDCENVYSLWKGKEEFQKWLIQIYILMYEKKLKYLEKVMMSLNSLTNEELIEKTYTCIFEKCNQNMLNERRRILNAISKMEKIEFNQRMIDYYSKFINETVKRKTTYELGNICFEQDEEYDENIQTNVKPVVIDEIVPILTDNSSFERQLIIWLLRMGILTKDAIKDMYINLLEYLDPNHNQVKNNSYSDKLNEYFDVYRNARIFKNRSVDYDNELNKWNGDEDTFYKWYTDSKIEYPESILKKNKFEGNTYVLDGVGAEFIEYIASILKRNKMNIELCTYSKAHLPSITSEAKEFYTMNNKWLSDYDNEVVHGDIYYPVKNLENALCIIEKIIKRIINEEGDRKFAIIADHGATVGHKIFKKDKKYNFDKADHDGRCLMLSDKENEQGTMDYIVYKSDSGRKWIVTLNEQSLYKNSRYIVHGGATPEEVIIPVIITQKDNSLSSEYSVKALELKVSGMQKKVKFRVNPKPERVRLKAKDNTDIYLKYDDVENIWVGEIRRGIEQNIKVIVENQEFDFRTIPTTRMGDDLFDD